MNYGMENGYICNLLLGLVLLGFYSIQFIDQS